MNELKLQLKALAVAALLWFPVLLLVAWLMSPEIFCFPPIGGGQYCF